MVKEGGPMDRLFFFRTDGVMVGDAGLDIQYGHINIRTGNLTGDVTVNSEGTQNTCAFFHFDAFQDAFEVRGGILELDIPINSLLFYGSIAESEMIWDSGDVSGTAPSLPYAAFHPEVVVHSQILSWFGSRRFVCSRCRYWLVQNPACFAEYL